MHGIALHMHRHGEPRFETPMHLDRTPSSHTLGKRHSSSAGESVTLWPPHPEPHLADRPGIGTGQVLADRKARRAALEPIWWPIWTGDGMKEAEEQP